MCFMVFRNICCLLVLYERWAPAVNTLSSLFPFIYTECLSSLNKGQTLCTLYRGGVCVSLLYREEADSFFIRRVTAEGLTTTTTYSLWGYSVGTVGHPAVTTLSSF